jgi:tetratricopeptide (TPR) repeat protein
VSIVATVGMRFLRILGLCLVAILLSRRLPPLAGINNGYLALHRSLAGHPNLLARARSHFNAALDAAPGTPQCYRGLGMIDVAEGKTSAAVEDFERAIQVAPGDHPSHYWLGVVFYQLGQTQDALLHWEKARTACYVALDLYRQALPKYNEGSYPAAERLLSDAVFFCPDLSDAYILLGSIYMRQGLDEKSLAAYETSVATSSQTTYKHFYASGWVYSLKAEWRQAEYAFHRALSIDPEKAGAGFLLGVALARQGRYEEAIPWLEKAVDREPDSVQWRFELADAYRATGERAQAAHQYYEILRVSPGNARALIKIEEVEAGQN